MLLFFKRDKPQGDIFDMISLADKEFYCGGIVGHNCRNMKIFLLDSPAVHRLKFARFGNAQVLEVCLFSLNTLRDCGNTRIAEFSAKQAVEDAL